MTKQDAYKIVYNDILNRDIGLFLGRFDAKKREACPCGIPPEIMYCEQSFSAQSLFCGE